MSLDIATPAGQTALAQERALLRAVEVSFPAIRCVETKKDAPAKVDGFLVGKGGIVTGVFESKCRDLSREQLRRFGDEWLITFEKIAAGADLARSLCVPFFGFLHLTPDGRGLALRITDEAGNFLPRIRLARTETQRTVNGGLAVRTNAYVNVEGAVEFPVAESA